MSNAACWLSLTLRELRAPPSANNLFANAGRLGRVPTTEYKKWQQEAGWTVKQQLAGRMPAKPIEDSVSVSIDAHLSRRRDIDNVVKPLLDLLVTLGIIEDDKWVDRITATRRPPFTGWPEERVTLHIEGVGDAGAERGGVLRGSAGGSAPDPVAVEGNAVADADAAR